MAAIHEQYTDEMHRQFGYFACWLPNTRLELGDVGVLSRDRFDKVTSLALLGVLFSSVTNGQPVDLEYSSAGQVEVSVSGDGRITPDPLVTLSVTFNRENATLFQAAECRVETVQDLSSLNEKLRQLSDSGIWRKEYVVVTELVRTGPAAILVSNQKGARVDFHLDAPAPITGALALAKASASMSTMSASGLAVKIIAPDGVTPLYRAVRLRRRFGGAPKLVYRDDQPPIEVAGDDVELATVTWDELTGAAT